MSKKNNGFGKFLAFTTAVAAIGGACYIFRDRIKESKLYKKSADKFSNLFGKASDNSADDEDDFFFDDEFEDDFADNLFSDSAKENREYTSITINQKGNAEDTNDDEIPFNTSNDKTEPDSVATSESESTDETSGYENEGLSDVSEDADSLDEQDKLDF